MDNKKLGDFFEDEYENLDRFVRNQLGDMPYDSSDIVQDVALNLFSKADISAEIENVAAYVYRALKNKVIDLFRKKRNKMETSLDQLGIELAGRELMDDQEEEQDLIRWKNDQFELIMDAFALLKPEQQEIIVLTELEGNTFESLSKRLKIPVGTLLSRKHRAMAKLQEILKAQNQ